MPTKPVITGAADKSEGIRNNTLRPALPTHGSPKRDFGDNSRCPHSTAGTASPAGAAFSRFGIFKKKTSGIAATVMIIMNLKSFT